MATEYLGMSFLTSRTTRFHDSSRLVADHFGRRTARTYLGLGYGSELVRGGRGDRVIEGGIVGLDSNDKTSGCKECVIFVL